MITTRRLLLLSLALCWTASASPGRADDAEKAFYAGKTVRMVVGAGVGGGYDIFSRLIAPYLARTLAATVIVENQPGAGGLVALNRLYAAAPDGLQSGSTALPRLAQLIGDQAARFDLASSLTCRRGRAARAVAGGAHLRSEVQQAIDARMKWRWASRRNVGARHRGRLHLRGAWARCYVVQG
jgi:hypothetical protein